MRNFIKYSSLGLRKPQGPVTPKGPSLKYAPTRKFTFLGNCLSVKLPYHNTSRQVPRSLLYNNYDRVKATNYKICSDTVIPDQSIGYWGYGRIDWDFYGPWLMGPLTHLSLSVTAYSAVSVDKNSSLFNPRAFEQTIVHFLTSYHGHEEVEGKPQQIAPLNWEPMNSNFQVPAVRFDINPTPGNLFFLSRHLIVFPISNSVWITLDFYFEGGEEGCRTIEEVEKKYSRDDMRRLIDEIVGSMSLELTGESLEQLNAVKKVCPDMRLSKEFAPLKWPATMESLLQEGDSALSTSKLQHQKIG